MKLLGVELHLLFFRGIQSPSAVSTCTDLAFLFVQILMTLKADIATFPVLMAGFIIIFDRFYSLVF